MPAHGGPAHMRIPRLHLPTSLVAGERHPLDAAAGNYLARVLRLGVGHPLILFNGQGGQYQATLISVSKRSV